MAEVLAWWLVVTIGGVASFPIAFSLFRALPDRGYAFAKALGLLLVGYALWMGATIGLVGNTRGGALLVLVALAIAGAVAWGRKRSEIQEFLAERWRYVLLVEALFAAAFFAAAWLRAFVPDIAGTEKPDEFAFLNAVLRTEHFPAYDPWLSGFSLSYYYFGFVLVGALTMITGVSAAVGFNLGLALMAALTVIVAFGVVYNLVAALGGERAGVVFGLVGVVLVVILGNLVGVLELMSVHGIGPSALYNWAAVEGLTPDKISPHWYPTENFWWWRSTRIPSSFDIKEFPFFSFVLGDLHPHVMVMPFSLMAVGVAFALLRGEKPLDARWWRSDPLAFGLLMILLGSISFLNAWSYPPVLALLMAAVFARNWRARGGALRPALADSAAFLLPVLVGSVILYLPFYWTSRGGLWPLAPVEVVVSPGLPAGSMATEPKHLLLSVGILLWIGTGVLAGLSWRWLRGLGARSLLALLPAVIPLAIWAAMALADLGGSRFMDELQARDSNLLTLALLVALTGLVGLAFVRALASEPDGRRDGLLVALAAFGVSVLVLLGAELFFQRDHLGGPRTNTVFKLYHHSWLFMAVAGAFALYYVWSRLRVPGDGGRMGWARAGGFAWFGVSIVLLLLGLVFPVVATFSRTNGFSNPQTLDGLAFARVFTPFDYEATEWLNDHVAGSPVILEAVGSPYSEGGRVSVRTGLPTVLQWPSHEIGFRGGPEPLAGREVDVARAYQTTSVEEARAVLEKYDVEYVYVGSLERQQYGEKGMAKFGEFMLPVFGNDGVTIYRMPRSGVVGAGLQD